MFFPFDQLSQMSCKLFSDCEPEGVKYVVIPVAASTGAQKDLSYPEQEPSLKVNTPILC